MSGSHGSMVSGLPASWTPTRGGAGLAHGGRSSRVSVPEACRIRTRRGPRPGPAGWCAPATGPVPVGPATGASRGSPSAGSSAARGFSRSRPP